MEFFDSTKSLVENLYLLSGPLLLLVALIGLYQIKIAKENLRINSRREAARLAIDLCDKYFKILKNHYQEIGHRMIDLKIDYKSIEGLNVKKLSHLESEVINNIEFKKSLIDDDILNHHLYAMTESLELFAIPFIRGIADEELAYHHHYYKFNQFVMICLPYVYKSRNEEPNRSEYFVNLIQLYNLWKSRNDKLDNSNKIKKLITENEQIKVEPIRPLGT